MSVTADKQTPSKLTVFVKARNLMDYTLKITANPKVFRPDLKDHEREIRGILEDEYGHIKENQDLEHIIVKLIDMLDNAIDPVDNIYVWLIRQLRQSACDIFIYAWRANNIRVGQNVEYKKTRLDYQKRAISACVDLKAYISLSKRMCHLKSRKVAYWNSQVSEIQSELTAWHNSDKDIYKNIN